MFLGNDQHMIGGRWINIPECQQVIVFKDLVNGGYPLQPFYKKGSSSIVLLPVFDVPTAVLSPQLPQA